MRLGLVIGCVGLAVSAAGADVSLDRWSASMAESRPRLPPVDADSPTVTATDFRKEAEVLAENLGERGDVSWSLELEQGIERLAVGECGPGAGIRWRFAVYSQLGNPCAYYWTGEGYAACTAGVETEARRRLGELFLKSGDRFSVRRAGRMLTADDFMVAGRSGHRISVPFERSWFFLIDDRPDANWAHPCRYVFFSEDLTRFAVSYQMYPPIFRGGDGQRKVGLQSEEHPVMVRSLAVVRNAVYANAAAMTDSGLRYLGDRSHSYFLLIGGGQDPAANGIRFWADTAMFYSTLTGKYGVPRSNILTLVSDGTDSRPDANLGDSDSPALISSPLDLDGDGIADVDGPANRKAMQSALKGLAAKLGQNDQLVVFITSHGGPIGVGGPNNFSCECTLFDYDEGNDEVFKDTELRKWTEGIRCPVAFAIESCYSGGFIDDITQTPKRVIMTACNHFEISSGYVEAGKWGERGEGETGSFNSWALPMTAAFRGRWPAVFTLKDPTFFWGDYSWSRKAAFPWEDGDACPADKDGNGFISLQEAGDFARRYDVFACRRTAHSLRCRDEHPQLAESSTGLAREMGLLKVNMSEMAYRIEFDANGGSGAPEPMMCFRNTVIRLPSSGMMCPGRRFGGWICEGRRYDAGVMVVNLAPAGGSVKMTAVWK